MTSTGRKSILVVDDEKNVRFTVTQALRKEGHEVDSAASGAEGVQRVRERDYDLLLVDLRMPGMTGIEMLREIRRHDLKMPAVIITAYGVPEQLVQAAELGAIESVRKPFSIQTIRAVVQDVFDCAEHGDDPDPATAVDHRRHGKFEMMRRDIEAARGYLERAVALNQHDVEAYLLLGVCSVIAHDETQAVERFRSALQVDPSCRAANEYLSWLARSPY